MAVYTDVTDEELQHFLAGYDIGGLLAYKGIAEGVENSNFLLHTGAGYFILTLYEKRVAASDLLNRNLYWTCLQMGLRVLFGLGLWVTWAFV